MTKNSTFTYETGPLIDELAELSANAKSVWKGIAQIGYKGKLGALAKELGNLAEQMEKVYTPPERKAEAETTRQAGQVRTGQGPGYVLPGASQECAQPMKEGDSK